MTARQVREAIERALPPIEFAVETFNENKPAIKQFPTCVSCHHEAMGLSTLSLLRKRGYAIDRALERTQAQTLLHFLELTRPTNERAAGGDAGSPVRRAPPARSQPQARAVRWIQAMSSIRHDRLARLPVTFMGACHPAADSYRVSMISARLDQ